MAEITYTPIEEPDGLNAASLNGPFATIRDGINDLPEGAPATGALNENHLPSMVVAQNSVRVGSLANQHSYTSGTYTVITRGGTDLEIDFGSPISIGTGTGVGGILVFMEVFVVRLSDGGAPPATTASAKAFSRIEYDPTGAGVFTGIQRTYRYMAGGFAGYAASFDGSPQRIVMSTQTLITSADSVAVQKIRGSVQVTTPGPAQTLELRECWLSAIVLRSSET